MPGMNDMDILSKALHNSYFEDDLLVTNDMSMISMYNTTTMDSTDMSTMSSPMSMTDDLLSPSAVSNPRVDIVDQPVDKFRFRYKSEMMGTHGCLSSVSTMSKRKRRAPTARLVDFMGAKAKIRCTLVAAESIDFLNKRMPHAHHLVKREGSVENDAPYDIEVSADNDWTAQFHGMGIIHTAKKNIKDELVKKMTLEALEKQKCKNPNNRTLRVSEETQIRMKADSAQKRMNLNSVCLCFQAFVEESNGILRPVTAPVYSNPINNLKSALTGELKICRIDKYSSSCDGGEEVFMLVEKVGKKNIKVKFFETDENDHEIWSDYGRFSELDVHHQYAIVFRTPPYMDRDIVVPKEVYIKLERPTDGDNSDPIKFTYKPTDSLLRNKKRARISYSGSSDYNKFSKMDVERLEAQMDTRSVQISSGSLSNHSQEILKLLGSWTSSGEYNKFLTDFNFEEYSELLSPELSPDDDENLTTDGSSSRKIEATFAESLITETMKKIRNDEKNTKEYFTKMFDERTTYGDTILHSALRHGPLEIVKAILMVAGSDPLYKNLVNLKNSSGKTPLHYAVLLNQPEVVSALLELGSDPNECDDRDFYPLHAAVKRPEAGACVDVLLKKNVKIGSRDEAGWTPLQLAVEAGSFHAVRSLIKAGADVNETEASYGRTALHIAVENGHIEIVKYILEKTNIDVNKTNFGGNTALHSAVVNTGERAKELCAILVEHGADPTIPNHNRESSECDEKEIAVDVKDEPIDDDIDHDAGQTSLDLASNKPEILSLFAQDSRKKNVDERVLTIKEEIIDDNTLTSLDSKTLNELASILDKNTSWKKLAKHLHCDYLLGTIDIEQCSPSLTILNYADIQGDLTMSSLAESLNKIGETEGVAFIKKIMDT